MNIAYILPCLKKNGPVVVAYELACQMVEKGHNVDVYYFDELSTNTLSFPCATIKISMLKAIDLAKYDIIHSHCLRPDLYVFLHKPLRNKNTKFLTTIHNFVLNDFITDFGRVRGVILANIWMFLLRRHDKRVVLSNIAKDYYKKWFKDSELEVIYNTRNIPLNDGLSTEEIREISAFKGDKPLLGTNAILTPIKGLDLVIQALKSVKDVRFFIVGDGRSKEDLQRLSYELGVSDRVYFAGYRENAYRYLAYYDVYLMPSRSEGFPLALLEAVAMRCKTIVSDLPIFKEIFSDKEVTFFEKENVDSLKSAIHIALNNDKSEAAYNRYINYYSPDIISGNYLNLYRKLLDD